MKTVAKIDPEHEYETAKKLIELASKNLLESGEFGSLDASVDNLMMAARVLMDREERRRGRSSPPKVLKPKGRGKGESRMEAKKLPSARFPNLEVKEVIHYPKQTPLCSCCSQKMRESGLFDRSEKLEVVPKQYYILRTLRPKFNCSHCHGGMVNTPAPLSIVPTSNYGDSLIIDAALSKYCDLIPLERYVQIADRGGVEGIPAQSLIGLTHHLANFLTPLYLKIKEQVQEAQVLLADETTHKMLEGDNTKSWYLWGFFCTHACYIEAHGTRSGDVVIEFLKDSRAQFLMSDGYGGYLKAINQINKDFNRAIKGVHCNAHAYRYLEEASGTWKDETKLLLELYGEIYKLEKQIKTENPSPQDKLDLRAKMLPLFEQIKTICQNTTATMMPQSTLEKGVNYFLNHYEELTLCTGNTSIPLDNNLSERELRAPVVGRKTWYGTHSKRGALTAATLFSIVQSCKLNNVNPRNYFPWITCRILNKEPILTPYQYLKSIKIMETQ